MGVEQGGECVLVLVRLECTEDVDLYKMVCFVYGIGYKNADRTQPLYIGQTTESLSVRWSKHRSSCRLHPNQNLHRYIVKNGGEKHFEMFVIEEIADIEQLRGREKHHIENLKPPLNVQHNHSNNKKIKVDTKSPQENRDGPFVSLVLFGKWLINDAKKALQMIT